MIYFAIFMLLVSTMAQAVDKGNLIERVQVKKNKIIVTVQRDFKRKFLKGDFFVEYEPEVNLEQFDYSVVTMPFLLNVIAIVWISGDTYYVNEMDTELFHSLGRIKKVFQTMYPKTKWNGELLVRKLVTHEYRPTYDGSERTAILFSGGLDSTSTMLAHLDKKQLLITAWGHWDLPLNESHLWNIRRNKTKELAEYFGNEASFIKSNYSGFLRWEYLSNITVEIPKWRLGAVEGLGWAGLTAPLLLSKGYPVLRIASSHSWLYPYPSASSPYVDNNISLCGLRVIHDQYDLTRSGKIAFIAKTIKEYNLPKPFLKVCSLEKKNDRNCCACRKCLSTIMGFFAVGEDPKLYGMPISLATAHTRVHALLAPSKLNCYTILYFKGVQARIRERLKRGERLPKELLALAEVNFDKKISIEDRLQEKINWMEMKQHLPELIIPTEIDDMPVMAH